MREYYLAVDIGASSGRHILGWIEDGRIKLQEIYRFHNGMKKDGEDLIWDTQSLFREIKNGLKYCKELGKIPKYMGIDTWAVDYVLLDAAGDPVGKTYGYRDSRTNGMDQIVYQVISQDELYQRTGIQKQLFNTIYQLMAVKQQHPEHLHQAESMLLIPDYFNFMLTGIKKTEYTNATTTQLVSPLTKEWDDDLISWLGYPRKLFGELTLPGTVVGNLAADIRAEIGYDLTVLQVATHDTASAVISVPAADKDFLYISSGTWSLMGVEQLEAICSAASQAANLTNEGGYQYRFRFLKNIMGLWMIQSVKKELNDQYSFARLCELAAENDHFPARVDVNDQSFLAPDSMMESIRSYCRRTNQPVPESPGELAAVIYQSLADSYAETVSEIEAITGKQYEALHVVGGGANADYLNQLTANAVKKTVYAGPGEATAIGNLVVQMIEDKQFGTIEEARQAIFDSFEIKQYRKKGE